MGEISIFKRTIPSMSVFVIVWTVSSLLFSVAPSHKHSIGIWLRTHWYNQFLFKQEDKLHALAASTVRRTAAANRKHKQSKSSQINVQLPFCFPPWNCRLFSLFFLELVLTFTLMFFRSAQIAKSFAQSVQRSQSQKCILSICQLKKNPLFQQEYAWHQYI